jgi:hypothetical protein
VVCAGELGRYINTDRPGQLHFLAYGKRYTADWPLDVEVIGYQVTPDNQLQAFKADIGCERPDDIVAITGPPGFLKVGNGISGKRRDVFHSTVNARGRGGGICLFQARDRYTAKELLSTPTDRLPMYYDEEHGLTIFNYYSSNRVVVRREREDLFGPGYVLADVLAHGRGFIDDRITHVFVLADGTVHRFNPDLVKLEPATELSWLAAVLKAAPLPVTAGDPAEFVFTGGMLACADAQAVTLLNRGGAKQRIDIEADSPGASPAVIGTEFQLIALDDTRLAVFDESNQRVVIVENAG